MDGARRSARPGGKGNRIEPSFGMRRGSPPRRRPPSRRIVRRARRKLKRVVAKHPLLYKALRFTLLAAI
jgi:hypothetical protein